MGALEQMTASDHIYRVIESRIALRELLPGDPIDEERLMEEFDVSRTPVREAILKLKAEGFVSSISRRGVIVAKMDLQELLSVWELLAELEGIAARYACERMTNQERETLANTHRSAQGVVERNDEIGWQQANMAFHEVLYKGARNPYLHQEILRMRVRTSAYRSHSFDAMGVIDKANRYHAQIVQAILGDDPQKAAKVATAHLTPGVGAPDLKVMVHRLPKDWLA